MRDGLNPLRQKELKHKIPPQVPVVVIVTHLPNEKGYHSSRWQIVTKSLQLARQNAGMEHWLVVWDNGSTPEFVDWLRTIYKPDQLILSKNIGVMNTMRRVMGMFIDCLVSWCNDDLIYYPDWLLKQVELIVAMPDNVATVSGCVTRYYMGKADDKTLDWAHDNDLPVSWVDTPLEWDIQHGASIGKVARTTESMYNGKKVPLISYNGQKAYIGGNHCQMTFYPIRLYNFTFNVNVYMVPLFQTFDVNINKKGMLRLLTKDRLTRHIGNRLMPDDMAELKDLLESESK